MSRLWVVFPSRIRISIAVLFSAVIADVVSDEFVSADVNAVITDVVKFKLQFEEPSSSTTSTESIDIALFGENAPRAVRNFLHFSDCGGNKSDIKLYANADPLYEAIDKYTKRKRAISSANDTNKQATKNENKQANNKTIPETDETIIPPLLPMLKGRYLNSVFHRIIPGNIAQGGNIFEDREDYISIYGDRGFSTEQEDEESDPSLKGKFTHLPHDAPGLLSVANAGPSTNAQQFLISLVDTPWLSGRHQVFGKIIFKFSEDGRGLSKKEEEHRLAMFLEKLGSAGTVPGDIKQKVRIVECKVVKGGG